MYTNCTTISAHLNGLIGSVDEGSAAKMPGTISPWSLGERVLVWEHGGKSMSERIWTKESGGKNLKERVCREESENRFHCTVSTERVTGIFERFRHVKVGKRVRESTKIYQKVCQRKPTREPTRESTKGPVKEPNQQVYRRFRHKTSETTAPFSARIGFRLSYLEFRNSSSNPWIERKQERPSPTYWPDEKSHRKNQMRAIREQLTQ